SLDSPLERVRAGFPGPDPHDLFEIGNEDLAVTDLAGVGGFLDRFDDAVEKIVLDCGFDLYLRQEIDDVFSAALKLAVPLLTTKALDLGDSDSLYADRRKSFADLIELERFDDCGDELHSFLADAGCDPITFSESLLHVGDELALRDVLAVVVRVELGVSVRSCAVDAYRQAVDLG